MDNSESLLTVVNYFLTLDPCYQIFNIFCYNGRFSNHVKMNAIFNNFCYLGLELSLSKFLNNWLKVEEGSSLHFFC